MLPQIQGVNLDIWCSEAAADQLLYADPRLLLQSVCSYGWFYPSPPEAPVSASLGRSGRAAVLESPKPQGRKPWGSVVFTVIALIGSFHALLMLGLETGRLLYTGREVTRLELQVAALSAQTDELSAILEHKDDPVFREQLARQQGFIGPDETRVLTRMP